MSIGFFQQQSAAARAAHPATTRAAMPWDPATPPVLQSGPWQCSACSSAWVLRSLGHAYTQDDVVAMLGPGRITPQLGLMQGDGSGLVAMLRQLGLPADHGPVDYAAALALAGTRPFAMGGERFNHWVAVRGEVDGALLLANPAPGYRGVYQHMDRLQFGQLGPFYAVWVDPSQGTGV